MGLGVSHGDGSARIDRSNNPFRGSGLGLGDLPDPVPTVGCLQGLPGPKGAIPHRATLKG